MADQMQSDFGRDGQARHPIGCVANESVDQIEGALARGEFVWLNLTGATDGEIQRAGEALRLHPLTIEDMQEFDQRAKVEDYADYIYIVAYGATLAHHDDDKLVEIHIVYSPNFLATVAAEESLALGKLHDQAEDRSFSGHELLHSVLDTLVDSYAPVLDNFDAEIERLEELVVQRDLRGRELEIHDLRRRLARIDRTVHRQLESFTSIREVLRRMPGQHAVEFPYFRDLQDHLIHVADSADAMRERIAGMFELYMAALDSRQNIIMKQFTVIAGIFLPLSVVTGFFGMNFAWLVREIESESAFMWLGVVFPLVVFALLVGVIASRGLFRE